MLIYFSDFALFPVHLKPEIKMHSCCANKMNREAAHHLPERCPNDSKDCSMPAYCMNCPLCFTVTISSLQTIENTFSIYNNSYASFSVNGLSDYFSESWKPPDFLSQI